MRHPTILLLASLLLISFGCERKPGGSAAGHPSTAPTSAGIGEVVIYSSIDEPYLRPLLQRFQKETGITARPVLDTEATRSAGLAERLLAEKDRPQADVFWGNEIFHTINLAEQGLFAPYRPPTAQDVPNKWRGAGDLYTDIGLRARMIGVSTRAENKALVANIQGVGDLVDPALKGKIGISHPAFGTASGQFAALDLAWGDERYGKWLGGLKTNGVKLLGGNSAVADQIAAGTLAAGLTDNDDINNAKSEGQPINLIVPDQGAGDVGALLIPGTIALVSGAPHPEHAKKLIDFLCRPEVEKELIAGRYLAYSVRDTGNVKAMEVDYVEVAHRMKHAVEMALNVLQERGGAK
jgi:iron(III) transport system substrate-binding protein